MKKSITLLFAAVLIAMYSKAQINFDEVSVEDWIGNGPNQAMFIIDFDSDAVGVDSTFAWGINFEGDSISGDTILSMIAASNENFTFSMNSGFLDNINFFTNNQNYTNPNAGWFAIYESMDGLIWNWNNGISDNIANDQWFGIVVMNPETWEAEINVPILTINYDHFQTKCYDIFPNPASNYLYFETLIPVEVTIHNLNGQILYKTFSASEKIDLKNFPEGMYIVKIIQANSITCEKIIVKK